MARPNKFIPGVRRDPNRRLGWIPDRPDHRDLKYSAVMPKIALPESVDLSPGMPEVWNQGDLGSCTAQSIAGAIAYARIKQKETPEFTPSRLFIYFNERAIEGTINEDAGAYIRTGIKVTNKIGFCDEELWPYNVDKFKVAPITKAYKNADLYKVASYYRMDGTKLDHIRTCLAAGFPFVFGFTVYDNMVEADTNGGIIPMPKADSRDEGGHAVCAVGYNDKTKLIKFRNSWGTDVGDKGYYYIPYEYITNPNLSDDFWTIRLVRETDGV